MIFERRIREDDLNLSNMSFESVGAESDKNTSGAKSSTAIEIKKYVFNSNKANTIYCICINGI